jgi:hypothetical protein
MEGALAGAPLPTLSVRLAIARSVGTMGVAPAPTRLVTDGGEWVTTPHTVEKEER